MGSGSEIVRLAAARCKIDVNTNGKREHRRTTGGSLRTTQELFWSCAPDGLFVIRAGDDGQFVFDDANPSYQRLVAHGVELAGTAPADRLPSDMAEMLLAQCRECVATGEPVEHDEFENSPNGSRCRRTTLTPVQDPETGTGFLLLGRLQDLSHKGHESEEHSRRLLKRVVDTSPDVIYVFDLAAGRNTFLSSRVRKVLGYSKEFLQSLDTSALLELIHPDDLPTVKQHLMKVRALTDGSIATVEYRCRTASGRHRWFRSKEAVFSRTLHGSVEKVVGILSDIDHLKKARIAFTEANTRLTALLASISDSYLTIDRACTITNINGAAAKWLGRDRQKVIGKPYWSIVVGSAARAVVKAAMHEKRTVHAEIPSQLHPGRWIDLRAYPSEEGVSIFFSDITKQKYAEQAAARSNVLLNASIDSLSTHIVILDAVGTIVAANKAWRNFAAMQRRKGLPVGSSNLLALYEHEGRRSSRSLKIASDLKSLLAGRRTTVHQIYQMHGGERKRWYQLSAARFVHQNTAFAVVATEDVTAVRKAERALGELSDRMLTLQEDERQRIAAELHDSTAQHLAAIGLNAMLLRARSASDTDTSMLWEDVEASLEEATQELRAFTYLLHPTRLVGDGLTAALRRYVEGYISRTGLKVTLNLGPEIDDLPSSLQQSMLRVVQEALANVHRHALASRISVRQTLAGDRLHLVISDNGSGIRGSRKRGTSEGVGIPAMRERLRQLGGSLNVKTGPRGTSVVVSVPLGKVRNVARGQAS